MRLLRAAILLTFAPWAMTQVRPGVNNDSPSVVVDDQQCVQSLLESSAEVGQRFSHAQLTWFCGNKLKWTTIARQRQAISDDLGVGLGLTPNQQAFLDHFHTCGSPQECVCSTTGCDRSRSKRQQPTRLERSIRKEYRMLTDQERDRFHSAVNRLKSDTVDNYSKYDLLVLYHTAQQAPGAHWGPAFLPWHRELLKQLEVAIRFYDPSVSLPYWDSTLDQGLPDPRHSVLWSDQFFGNGDGTVSTGPFQTWTTYHPVDNQTRIIRRVGESPFGDLYRPSDIESILQKTGFSQLTHCIDPLFELLHGTVHVWVGGHMLDVPISPNDPAFFLHHAFVDWIWEEFRQRKQSAQARIREYPDDSHCCSTFHYANSTMLPFRLRNMDGLNAVYSDVFYTYQPPPTCSATNVDCGSPYLVCDSRHWRCLSKIKLGGNCTGFEDPAVNLCLGGICVQGVCQSSPNIPVQPSGVTVPDNAIGASSTSLVPPAIVPTTSAATPAAIPSVPPAVIPTAISEATQAVTPATIPALTPAVIPAAVSEATQAVTPATIPALTPAVIPAAVSEATQAVTPATILVATPATIPAVASAATPPVPLAFSTPAFNKETTVPWMTPQTPEVTIRVIEVTDGQTTNGQSEMTYGRCPPCHCPGYTMTELQTGILANVVPPSDRNADDAAEVTEPTPTYVWFTVTVLTSRQDSEVKEPAIGAVLTAQGVSYNDTYEIRIENRTDFPYLGGVTVVRMANPGALPLFDSVAQLSVHDPDGYSCRTLCRLSSSVGYAACEGLVQLSVNNYTENLQYYESSDAALRGAWYDGQRRTDYFLFLCDYRGQSTDLARQPNDCKFLRFKNFVLIGFAEFAESGRTLDQCKQICREGGPDRQWRCASITHWPQDGLCVITRESRLSQPALFKYIANENVVYYDYVCDFNLYFEW